MFPLGTERLYCYATADATAGVVTEDDKAELVRLFGGWHDPIPQIVAGLEEGQILRQDIEELGSPLPAFHGGRVVLIGDAAHAMTPELGQGGCLAIEDGVVMGSVLADEPSIPAALQRFSALRLPRTTAVALRSRRGARMHQLPYPVQLLLARAMGLVPGPSSPGPWGRSWIGIRRSTRHRQVRRGRPRSPARTPLGEGGPRSIGSNEGHPHPQLVRVKGTFVQSPRSARGQRPAT